LMGLQKSNVQHRARDASLRRSERGGCERLRRCTTASENALGLEAPPGQSRVAVEYPPASITPTSDCATTMLRGPVRLLRTANTVRRSEKGGSERQIVAAPAHLHNTLRPESNTGTLTSCCRSPACRNHTHGWVPQPPRPRGPGARRLLPTYWSTRSSERKVVSAVIASPQPPETHFGRKGMAKALRRCISSSETPSAGKQRRSGHELMP